MSADISRETLELETNIARMREEMLTELARRHNWAQQEEFWQRNMRNWESQEKYWLWQNRLLLGTFILGVLGIISRVLWP